jgi:predicted DsbA family dithiol-disulfide isomerase
VSSQPSTPSQGAILEIAFDYVDPGSYRVHRLLSAWLAGGGGPGGDAAEGDAAVGDAAWGELRPGGVPSPGRWLGEVALRWAPLELRLPGEALVDPREEAWDALARAVKEEALAMGDPFQVPRHVPRTRKAHELALHAREKGAFGAVHDALFRAHFEKGEDLGRVDVLVRLAEVAGLDGSEARTVLGVDRFLEEVEGERSRLLAEGVRGVPTLRLHEGVGGGAGPLAGSEQSEEVQEGMQEGRTLVLLEGYGGAAPFRDAMLAGAEAWAAWRQPDNRGR